MYYVVTSDGNVRSYRQKGIAAAMKLQLGEGTEIAEATDKAEDLSKLSTPMLVTLHNLCRPEKPVTRFADRATAEKRLKGVLEVLAKPGEAPVNFENEGSTEGSGGASSDAEEMVEVEDDSPLTPEEFTPDPTKTPEENEAMATAARNARPKKSVKKSAAKKSAAKRAPRADAAPISDATVRKVIKMRADGKSWPEILKELGEKSNNFILRVRPLMKKLDKSSVMAIGPGSPNYGKGAKKGKKGGK
jgi:hypothetical protein